MDTQILGTTTMKLMDSLDKLEMKIPDVRIVSVAIIVCVEGTDEDGDISTFERTFFSEEIYYRQLGLMYAGLEAVRDGKIPDDEGSNE